MNVGFVGATGHTGIVVHGLDSLPDTEVVGVCPGSSGESVDELYEQVLDVSSSATLFETPEELLEESLDLVVVACRFGDLADRTIAALERGYHVYTEKPVATTLEDLRRVRSAYENSTGELAAMLSLRYSSAFYTAYNRVENGSVGEVRLLNCQKSYVLGERDEFFRTRATHGGMIPWVGSHAIDWMHWFTDLPVHSIRARHSRRGNRGHGDLEVSGIVDVELDTEVFATITLDYLRPDTAPSHGDDRFRVVGTEGVIEVLDGSVYLIDRDADGRRKLPLDSTRNPFVDFVEGIEGDSQPRLTAEDSFRTTETSLLARNAADSGEIVTLD